MTYTIATSNDAPLWTGPKIVVFPKFQVLATMFASVSNNLPKTSYIKMIDIWLVASLFMTFTVVLLQTLADSYRNVDSSSEHSKKLFDTRKAFEKNPKSGYSDDYYDPKTVYIVKKVLFVGIPSLFLSFSVIYWLLGLYIYYY